MPPQVGGFYTKQNTDDINKWMEGRKEGWVLEIMVSDIAH